MTVRAKGHSRFTRSFFVRDEAVRRHRAVHDHLAHEVPGATATSTHSTEAGTGRVVQQPGGRSTGPGGTPPRPVPLHGRAYERDELIAAACRL
ncbi:hypothetical protein L1080_031120 [Rhodococcus sp. MSC1_016]